MTILLIYAVTLVIAVYVSELAARTVLSKAVLFLLAGFAAGGHSPGWITPTPDVVRIVSEVTLFAVLFTDGMRLERNELFGACRLSGRAMFLGLPLTLAGNALAARLVVGLPWLDALLLGTILAPTDPVLVSAIVGEQRVPARVRTLLNIESGFNDGPVLPAVLILPAILRGGSAPIWQTAAQAAGGVALGIAVPSVAILLLQMRFFAATTWYKPLLPFAIGLLIFALSSFTQVNAFLAAFSAGVTVASLGGELREAFGGFGEQLVELLKLPALMLFGALISWDFLEQILSAGYLFAGLVLVAVRPAALKIALFGAGLPRSEWLVAAWFGPKGFASVSYALLMMSMGIARREYLFHLAALVVALSVVAHSSTDAPAARSLGRGSPEPETIGKPR